VNGTRLKTFVWWLPVLIWAGVIFYASTRTFGHAFSDRLLSDAFAFLHLEISHHQFRLLATGFRKLGHFSEYAIFTIFLYYALGGGHGSAFSSKRALGCILLAGLYSLTDEFHQSFVPNRGSSIVDCGFDTIGATLGMVIVYFTGKGKTWRGENAPQEPAGDNHSSSPS